MNRKFLVFGLLFLVGLALTPGFVMADDEEPSLDGSPGLGGPGSGDPGPVETVDALGGTWRAKFANDDCGLNFQCRDDGFQPQGTFFGTCTNSQRNRLADVASDVCTFLD